MRKITIVLLIVLLAMLAGCAKFSGEYMPPIAPSIKNSQSFSKSYDIVWKATVDSVAKSFWTLSNIEKDSGILSLYYITDNPSECVDCGVTKVELTQFGKYAGTIVRNPAQPKYEYTTHGGKHHNVVIEQSSLRCDCNIVVSQISENETLVTVNTIYNLELWKGNTVVFNKDVGKYVYTPIPVCMSFTSGNSGKGGEYMCVPTYSLEKAIFAGIESYLKNK
ncbi:MAG: hypothetical protein IJD65_00610 [Mailhella sp.]|nr:hypothetical protein [Mailhella sp.]